MERTGALIERLLQQYHDNADAAKMLVTIQLLAAELQQQAHATSGAGKSVSVVMPAYINNVTTVQDAPVAPKPAVTIPAKETPAAVAIQPPVEEARPPVPLQKPELVIPRTPPQFDPVKEIPTLAHQQNTRTELNEMIGSKGESLNERLRANSIELGAVLQSSPVKDLKKAIGINDRYVFINELFRGDEVMYERSIKTINSFSILAEAEFWIKRELKLKLAWNETSEAVKVFDQLVKRRFS